MKITTDSVRQAIEFALNEPKVKKQIQDLEAPPDKFIIYQVTSTVINYNQNIIRVIINFNEKGNPNSFKEDTLIDIQGTSFSNFKILNLIATQFNP